MPSLDVLLLLMMMVLVLSLTAPSPVDLVCLQFVMPSPDVLHVTSTVTVNGQTCKWRQVYNKKQ